MNKALLASLVAAAFVSASPFASAETADSAEPTILAQAGPSEATALAQAQPGSPDAARAQRPGADRQHFRSGAERVEARLAYVRTALKITDAQQPQWDNLANVMRKQARDRDQRMQQFHAKWEAARAQGQGQRADGAMQRPQRPNVSAIERLERTQQRMTERSARLNEVITAAKPLYAAFSPEQKQIADAMLAQQGHGGPGRHGGHRHQQHRGMDRGA
jgi:phage shock protein A